jgi:hypothetical protein
LAKNAQSITEPGLVRDALGMVAVQKGVGALQKIGNGPDPNAHTTQDVKLLITSLRQNPDKIIEQHYVGYSFYSGTPAADVGTLQGGSSESYAYANGTRDMPTVLGFEGVGRPAGTTLLARFRPWWGCRGRRTRPEWSESPC